MVHREQPIHDGGIRDLDRQLSALVEAAHADVDRSDDRRTTVRNHHLRMQLQVLELVNLDAGIMHDLKRRNSVGQTPLAERMHGPRDHAYFDAARPRPYDMLDDRWVLKAVIRDDKCVLGAVDEMSETLPPVPGTPDETGWLTGLKAPPVPIGLETRDDLRHFVPIGGTDRVVARVGEILGLPIARLLKCRLVIDDERLLVSRTGLGTAGLPAAAPAPKAPAGGNPPAKSLGSLRVHHDSHRHPSLVGFNKGIGH